MNDPFPEPNPLHSHAALSGRDSLEMARALGPRLRHVHLCDGSGSLDEGRVFDEHLLPGYGSQPVSEVLQYLSDTGWSGNIVAEVNTRKAKTEDERLALLTETLAFGRQTAAKCLSAAVIQPPTSSDSCGSCAGRLLQNISQFLQFW